MELGMAEDRNALIFILALPVLKCPQIGHLLFANVWYVFFVMYLLPMYGKELNVNI